MYDVVGKELDVWRWSLIEGSLAGSSAAMKKCSLKMVIGTFLTVPLVDSFIKLVISFANYTNSS